MARRILGSLNGAASRLTRRFVVTFAATNSQIALGACRMICFATGGVASPTEREVDLAGDKGQGAGCETGNDAPLDGVEIGPPRLPIVWVAHELDRVVGLELHELERPGADRVEAHVLGLPMARIDGPHAGGQQRDQRRLRLRQVERRLMLAVDRDLLEVRVPDAARVLAEIILPNQALPGALHVFGRERLAVVPFHPLAQLEGEPGAARIPRPALGQVRDDAVHAVERLRLIEQHEVVEHRHEGRHRRNRQLLMDRCARRVRAL